jgi:hypothetical protein
MPNSTHRPATDSRALNAIAMINEAVVNSDPIRRAGLLADAQRQIARALTSCLDECVETDGVTWSAVAEAVGVGRETLFRQHKARAPIVVIKSTHTPQKEVAMIDSVYSFETENGDWFGPSDTHQTGQYRSGILAFYPNPATGQNKLSGQMLRVRIGPVPADEVSTHAAMIHLPDSSAERVRLTDEVLALLFNDSRTPLCQAMVATFNAVINDSSADIALRTAVDTATIAMVPDKFTEAELIAAVKNVLVEAEEHPDMDTTARIAISRLRQTLRDLESWTRIRNS